MSASKLPVSDFSSYLDANVFSTTKNLVTSSAEVLVACSIAVLHPIYKHHFFGSLHRGSSTKMILLNTLSFQSNTQNFPLHGCFLPEERKWKEGTIQGEMKMKGKKNYTEDLRLKVSCFTRFHVIEQDVHLSAKGLPRCWKSKLKSEPSS